MLDTTASSVSEPAETPEPPSAIETPGVHAIGSEAVTARAVIAGLGIAVRQLVRPQWVRTDIASLTDGFGEIPGAV
jgi:hypothetical protein